MRWQLIGIVLVLGMEGPASAQPPSIRLHGVVNAANFYAPGLPGESIARGSIFSIFGSALGPAQGTQVSAFPLQNVLAGVTITVTQRGAVVNALPLYVRQDQINAVMPSNAPLGLGLHAGHVQQRVEQSFTRLRSKRQRRDFQLDGNRDWSGRDEQFPERGKPASELNSQLCQARSNRDSVRDRAGTARRN